MRNYYIIIEDMPSPVSHKLSIIKYVVLKKIIFFFLCFDHLIRGQAQRARAPIAIVCFINIIRGQAQRAVAPYWNRMFYYYY